MTSPRPTPPPRAPNIPTPADVQRAATEGWKPVGKPKAPDKNDNPWDAAQIPEGTAHKAAPPSEEPMPERAWSLAVTTREKWALLLGIAVGFGLALAYGGLIVVVPVQGQGVYVVNKVTGGLDFCVGAKCVSR